MKKLFITLIMVFSLISLTSATPKPYQQVNLVYNNGVDDLDKIKLDMYNYYLKGYVVIYMEVIQNRDTQLVDVVIIMER